MILTAPNKTVEAVEAVETFSMELTPIPQPSYESLGLITISHYCLEDYPHICNNGDPSKTASGQPPIPYYSVAAGPKIPFYSELLINGEPFIVLDRGGNISNKCIDIAVPTHQEALKLGVYQTEVFIRKDQTTMDIQILTDIMDMYEALITDPNLSQEDRNICEARYYALESAIEAVELLNPCPIGEGGVCLNCGSMEVDYNDNYCSECGQAFCEEYQ